ncbi:MAG: 50S ribosomal protein L31 [bacterium]|nr:50S ribosomal protein L31 [bacterium]
MKSSIHPKWYPEAKVICSCGNTFTAGSTIEEIHVEICSSCHPFFTGSMKYIDTAGRVEKFQKKQAQSLQTPQVNKKEKKLLKRLAAEKAEQERPKSLGEMLHRGKRENQENKKK